MSLIELRGGIGLLVLCLALLHADALAQQPTDNNKSLSKILQYRGSICSDFEIESGKTLSGNIYNNKILLYLNNSVKDSAEFALFDLDNNSCSRLRLAAPGMDSLAGVGQGNCLAFNQHTVALTLANAETLWWQIFNGLSTDNYSPASTFNNCGSSPEYYETYDLIDINNAASNSRGPAPLVASKIYNTHPRASPTPALVDYIDLEACSVTEHLPLKFDAVEISYFKPHKWVDVNNRFVAAANASRYSIRMFNHKGQLTTTITRAPPDYWQTLDTQAIIKAARKIPDGKPRAKISAIRELYYPKSSLNRIEFIDSNRLAVRVRAGQSAKRLQIYYWDIWRFDGKKGWQIEHADLKQTLRQEKSEAIYGANHFPLMTNRDMLFMNSRYLVSFRYASPQPILGRTYRQYMDDEDSYIAEHRPRLWADVYEWSFANVESSE